MRGGVAKAHRSADGQCAAVDRQAPATPPSSTAYEQEARAWAARRAADRRAVASMVFVLLLCGFFFFCGVLLVRRGR